MALNPALGVVCRDTQGSKLGHAVQTLLMRPVVRPAIVGPGRLGEMDFVERCFAVATMACVIVLVTSAASLMAL